MPPKKKGPTMPNPVLRGSGLQLKKHLRTGSRGYRRCGAGRAWTAAPKRSGPRAPLTKLYLACPAARELQAGPRTRIRIGAVCVGGYTGTTSFLLRRLPGPCGPDAIPGRFSSSSSLPPLFASGRFAAFLSPATGLTGSACFQAAIAGKRPRSQHRSRVV